MGMIRNGIDGIFSASQWLKGPVNRIPAMIPPKKPISPKTSLKRPFAEPRIIKKARTAPKMRSTYSIKSYKEESLSRTICCTNLPSACPFTFGIITPITFPISARDEGFTSATIESTNCWICFSSNCLGRYS